MIIIEMKQIEQKSRNRKTFNWDAHIIISHNMIFPEVVYKVVYTQYISTAPKKALLSIR